MNRNKYETEVCEGGGQDGSSAYHDSGSCSIHTRMFVRACVCVFIVPCVVEMLTMKKPSLSTSPWRMIHFPAWTVTSLSMRTSFRLCPPTSMFAKNLKFSIIWRNE